MNKEISKYDFYPFNQESLVWSKNNKAILKRKNPAYELMENITSFHTQEYYYCGYVVFHKSEIPKSWMKKEKKFFLNSETIMNDVDNIHLLAIHGGITFAEAFDDYNFAVYGFDTNHAGDDEDSNLQNLDYIIKLTYQMEDQLKYHAKNIKEYRKLITIEEQVNYIDKIRQKAKHEVALNYMGMFSLALGSK